MEEKPAAYLSPKLEIREQATQEGPGAFATAPIEAGELLVVWSGYIVDGEQLGALSSLQRRHSIQVEEQLYLVSSRLDEPADYINHSCDPNAGLSGQIALVAMRPILVGEEIAFDYAMSDGSPYDEFDCGCGALNCRRKITGDDWRRPELWERYAGYFSPYLQRRIASLRAKPVPASPTIYAWGTRPGLGQDQIAV